MRLSGQTTTEYIRTSLAFDFLGFMVSVEYLQGFVASAKPSRLHYTAAEFHWKSAF
jgi:hypothetical protein